MHARTHARMRCEMRVPSDDPAYRVYGRVSLPCLCCHTGTPHQEEEEEELDAAYSTCLLTLLTCRTGKWEVLEVLESGGWKKVVGYLAANPPVVCEFYVQYIIHTFTIQHTVPTYLSRPYFRHLRRQTFLCHLLIMSGTGERQVGDDPCS